LSAAFYCVADDRYFLGAVGLVNSLRLVGHSEPIRMLDCGLTDEQRGLLEAEVELVPCPVERPPWLLKTIAPLASPSDAMLLLDVDMVATRSLAPLVDEARGGRLAAFLNPIDRHCPEWGALLGLGETPRRPYLSSAVIGADRELATRILELMEELQDRIDFELTWWRRNIAGYAFTYGDQDLFNAIVSARVEAGRVTAIDERLAPTPPFAGLRLLDERSLRCAYSDGAEPYLVHHHVTKPWLEPTYHGVYSRLLRRLLVADDVPVRVPPRLIPRRLGQGLGALAARKRTNARQRLRWHVEEPLRALVARRQGKRGE
jgi:hypothetical protein